MLKLKHIHFSVSNKTLINDLSFAVDAGEHVVILGANGAGKSTLLKILSGEITDYRGEILLNDKNIRQYSKADLARTRAVMPQEVQLSFPFRAREVVEMGHTPHINQHHNSKITLQCMKLFDIEHLAERRYPGLSGGEKQRVQLARVFCQLDIHSDVKEKITHTQCQRFLFLDECTSALDPAHQHIVFSAVNRIKQQGIGVISVMHDLNLASQYADRIVILKEGEILVQGDVYETLTSEFMRRAYAIDTQVVSHPTNQKPIVISTGCVTA